MEAGDIDALCRAPEGDRVERKRWARKSDSTLEKICRAICAFGNDLGGRGLPGVVVVGLNDDGSGSGIEIDDELLRLLASCRETVQPFPTIMVEKVRVQECDVAVVVVQPSSNPPLRQDGRVWVRVGPTTALASPEDERHLTERRRLGNLPFDSQPVEMATLDDLDLDWFQRQYLPKAVAPDVLAANRRSSGQQLAALHLTTPDGVPTVAGVLVIGKDPRSHLPGACVQFLRFDGTTLTDPIKNEKRLSGPLAELLGELDDLIRININVAVDITSSPTEIRHPDYPVVAIQQLVRNAIMHRAYDGTNAPVRLYWYSDRIEIHSPGGPFGRVTVDNFGEPGLTDYRNPLLAEAMKTLGFVQQYGIGISLARRHLEDNGNPELRFEVSRHNVMAVIEMAR